MQLCLEHTTKDVSDQGRLENAFLVLLAGRGAECTGVGPFVLGANIRHDDLLVNLRHVNFLQLLVHVIEQEAEKVTCVLLLTLWIVHLKEGLKDPLRVDDPLGK